MFQRRVLKIKTNQSIDRASIGTLFTAAVEHFAHHSEWLMKMTRFKGAIAVAKRWADTDLI
jgi:hypothetical protein